MEAPSTNSSGRSSSARAVARATTLVMPSPRASSCSCSSGRNTRPVKPERCRAGQKRFPGRAKWYPVAAEYRPGLMPANSTRRPGAMTSGIVRSLAASRSACVGRGGPVTAFATTPTLGHGERGFERLPGGGHPELEHQPDPPRVGEEARFPDGVTVDDDQVGQLAGLNGADVLIQAEGLRGGPGGSGEAFGGGEPLVDHPPDLQPRRQA